MAHFDEITQSLVGLDVSKTADLTKEALEQGEPALEVLNQGLLPAMKTIGDRFQTGEFFLPELILAGRAMQAAMAHLKPVFQRDGTTIRGTVAIGTVKEDIHDIGKNLVGMMCEGAGFEVINLGFDVDPEKFVEAVKENQPNIVGMSAMLTTTMIAMGYTIKALKEAGLRDTVKVIIGGSPVDAEIVERIGADGYAYNSPTAVELAKRLVGAA